MTEITHNGKIIAIENDKITVLFKKHSSCAGCEIQKACALNKSNNQTVTLSTTNTKNYIIGQNIELEISQNTGFLAMFYAYGLPLLLILSALFITWYVSKNEPLAGTISLLILVPYYTLLYCYKDKLAQKIKIKIR